MKRDKKRNSARSRIMRLLKWLIPVAIVGALVGLAMQPEAVEVDAGTVVKATMRVTINDDGETRVRERYRLSAPLSGNLLRIALDPGSPVKKGDVLATIDPAAPDLLDPRSRAKAQAAVRAAEAGVASAQIRLQALDTEAAQLRKAFERNRILHEKGNVADAAFERAESAYLAAKHASEAGTSAVQIARFELEQAKAALLRFGDVADAQSFEIRSPIDGTVLGIEDKSARMVQAGAALLEIGDPALLEMRIDVLSQDAVKIKPGQLVIVEHWGGQQALSGRVRRIDPSAHTEVSALGVDEQRVDVIADFDSSPSGDESISDGYRIEARIVIWEKEDVVQVPTGALFRQGEQWAAYKIDAGHARLTLLELGHSNGEFAEVISGLKAGDQVILHPGDRITEATLIESRS